LTTNRSPISLWESEGIVSGSLIADALSKRTPSEETNMTEQRQHARYQVEFPATFAGDHDGIGIVYNLGMGGCKVVSTLSVKNGALLTVHLQIPEQTIAITIRAATVRWTMGMEFGLEFLGMHELERTRLVQFLATQVNITA
jgi:PilZ domain-containing protein